MWKLINVVEDRDHSVRETTWALPVTHGCLVKTTTVARTWYEGRSMAQAVVFVPNLTVNPQGELGHRP